MFTDNDRMERLLSVLTGEAKKSVECIGTSGIFYATALKGLKRDFGNPTVVSHLKLKQLLDKPQITTNDRTNLRRYHQQLKCTTTWLKVMGYHSALTSTENLPKAVIRLPNKLRQSFYKMSKDSLSCAGSVTLIQFENWLEARLQEYFNPIAEKIAAKEQQKGKGDRNSKASNNNINKDSRKDGTTANSKCWLCSADHKIWKCESFKGKTPEERQKLAKDLKLCFN